MRAIRRLAFLARSDAGPDGWLATGLAASIAAYAVGMLTFDSFAFIQVTFLVFIMLGFAAVATRDRVPKRLGSNAPAEARAIRSRRLR